MPVSPGRGRSAGGDGSEKIVYPVDHMREVAAKILVQASNVQSEHDAIWNQILDQMREFAPAWRETLMPSLQPYAARLRSSYDWRIDLASALFSAIDAIEGNEDTINRGFHQHSGRQPG